MKGKSGQDDVLDLYLKVSRRITASIHFCAPIYIHRDFMEKRESRE